MNDQIHDCREAAQLLLGVDGVEVVSVKADPTEEPQIEVELSANRVLPGVLDVLADRNLSLRPSVETYGDPTRTVITAYRG